MLFVQVTQVYALLRSDCHPFEEIAALGCHIEGEPARKLRPELIAVWYEEETREREPKTRLAE